MIETLIGNPELDYLFDEDQTRKTKEFLDLEKTYLSTIGENCIPIRGNIVHAKYLRSNSDFHIFTLPGAKDDIRVDNKVSENKYISSFEEGMEIDLIITTNENSPMLKGSVSMLYENRAHKVLQGLESGQSVKAKVLTSTPAGYDVEVIHGNVNLPAFMPNTLAGINKLPDPNSIVGQTFQVMIESYAEQEGTYIVSRKKYLRSLIPLEIEKLETEKTYTGFVTGTTPFGVFVEFNECLTGMIHRANLNPEWQDKISEIKPGFEIDFFIKEIIKGKKNQKIILTQILRETLWDTISEGEIIEGKVKSIKNFGILVNLDDETVGLIQNKEKGNRKYEEGKKVKVVISSIDKPNRKIFLTPFTKSQIKQQESED